MRAPLSIIIPTLNTGNQLPRTAACLMEGLNSGLVRDLIVTDGGSNDDTATIGEDLGATFIVGAAGRGGQLRRGAGVAQGTWMMFLHADTHLLPGWSTVVENHIRTSQNAGYFRLQFRDGGLMGRVFAAGANIRSKFGLPYGDQGLLISRALYDQVGGYKDMALMEDVAIARALKGKLIMLAGKAATDAGRYKKAGWIRRGARNLWTLTRYLSGADPEKLARYYDG